MAPLADSALVATGRALLARAADAVPHLVAREKPVPTKTITGITIGAVA